MGFKRNLYPFQNGKKKMIGFISATFLAESSNQIHVSDIIHKNNK